jgi:hypothetical protein
MLRFLDLRFSCIVGLFYVVLFKSPHKYSKELPLYGGENLRRVEIAIYLKFSFSSFGLF